MSLKDITVNIRVEREGLLLHCWIGKYGKKTINLQEQYGLSDQDGQELLRQLDEYKAEEKQCQQIQL